MDGKAICEVMLYSYKDLEEKCNGVEYRILKQAQRSRRADIYETFDKLVLLINEKIAYCNVKVIIDEAVEKIGDSRVVKGHYISGRSLKAIAEEYCLTTDEMSEMFFKQKKAVTRAILDAYSTDKLFEIISDSKWLLNQYKAMERARNGSI